METESVTPAADALPVDAEGIDARISEQTLADFKDDYPSSKLPREEPAAAVSVPVTDAVPPVRHRAKSQTASPDDVKAIGELTKRAKEAEAKAFADIKQNAGESDRVFALRRRAEIAERVAAGPAAAPVIAAQPAVAQPLAARPAPVVAASKDDPEPDPAKYEDLTKYFRDQSLWAGREAIRQDRAEQTRTTQAETLRTETARIRANWETNTAAAKTRYPDFEAVAYGPLRVADYPGLTEIPQGSLIDAWIWEKPYGADLLYTLKKTPAEFSRIFSLPLADQVEELTLLGQRLKPTRMPAVTTGAAATTEVKPVPRPPTPVRTGPMRTSDDALPDTESLSLDGFAEATGANGRRR